MGKRFRKPAITVAIGVNGVGTEGTVCQYDLKRISGVRDTEFSGYIPVEPRGRTEHSLLKSWHTDKNDLGAVLLGHHDHGAKIVGHLPFVNPVYKIIAAVAQNHQARVYLVEHLRQPSQSGCSQFSRHARRNDLPSDHFFEDSGIALPIHRPNTVSKAVSECKYDGIPGQGRKTWCWPSQTVQG